MIVRLCVCAVVPLCFCASRFCAVRCAHSLYAVRINCARAYQLCVVLRSHLCVSFMFVRRRPLSSSGIGADFRSYSPCPIACGRNRGRIARRAAPRRGRARSRRSAEAEHPHTLRTFREEMEQRRWAFFLATPDGVFFLQAQTRLSKRNRFDFHTSPLCQISVCTVGFAPNRHAQTPTAVNAQLCAAMSIPKLIASSASQLMLANLHPIQHCYVCTNNLPIVMISCRLLFCSCALLLVVRDRLLFLHFLFANFLLNFVPN